MAERISVSKFPDRKASLCGFACSEPCLVCGKEQADDLYVIHMNGERKDQRTVLCGKCAGYLLKNLTDVLRKDK